MKTVWKYTGWDFATAVHDHINIEMPKGAEVLTAQLQGTHQVQIWALVDDPYDAVERRYFRIAGTGHAIGEQVVRYIGTVQLMGGRLVFHVFEVAA